MRSMTKPLPRSGDLTRGGPGARGDHVLGDELGQLPEVAWQREQLRGFPGDEVVGPQPRHAGHRVQPRGLYLDNSAIATHSAKHVNPTGQYRCGVILVT